MRIVIRLRLRRGDYVPVCPAGLQYLAFPSLGGPSAPSVLLGLSATIVPRLPYPFPPSLIPSPPFTSFSSSLSLRFSKEERRKFEMTANGNRKDGGSGEITIESRLEQERGVMEGKNCIHSNHIRERHRALRNQLNGEKLVVWREIAGPKRVEGVKEGEKAMGLGGPPSRLCQVDEAGKDEKTDGERRNLQ